MREPPGPCGAGRLRCVCWAWPLCVPAGGGPPRGLFCWAWPLCVPVGGGPPARSPHASLRLGVVDLEARPGPATAHRHRGQALQASAGPAAASYRSGLLSVSCPPWPSGPSCALHTGACGAVCGGASSRCPAGRTAAFHRSGIIVVSGLVLPPPINFACNSPPLSCRFVSVCSVVSLVFLNCMRLLLNAAPDSARRYRGGAFWTLSALPIDQTGCVRG